MKCYHNREDGILETRDRRVYKETNYFCCVCADTYPSYVSRYMEIQNNIKIHYRSDSEIARIELLCDAWHGSCENDEYDRIGGRYYHTFGNDGSDVNNSSYYYPIDNYNDNDNDNDNY